MNLLQLVTNPYTLTFLISLLTNLVLIIYILRRNYNSLTILMFLFYLCGTLVMGMGQMMASLSFEKNSFEFWNAIFYIGILFYPATYLTFTMSFLGKEAVLRNFFFWLFLIGPTVIMIFLSLHAGDLVTVNDFAQTKIYPWGYQVFAKGQLSALILIWYQLCFFTSLFLLIKFYRKTNDPIIKKQVRLLMVAMTIPFIGGALTQGLLPQFGIRIFPIGVPLNTINMMIIAYAIIKYGLSVIDPSSVASQVTKIMPSSVIVINSQKKIILVNPAAERFLGFRKDHLVGEFIQKILPEEFGVNQFQEKVLTPLELNPQVEAEGIIQTLSSNKIPVNIYAVNYNDKINGFGATILVLADIQKLKNLQNEIEKEKENVQEKVEQRTRELRDEQAKLQASINSLNVGFIIIDKWTGQIDFNQAAKRIFSVEDSGAQTIDQINLTLGVISRKLSPSLDLIAQISHCMDSQEIGVFKEISLNDKFLRITLTPTIISEGDRREVSGCVILVVDYTEDKIIERSREEFFTLGSHELRTPLAIIRGYSAMLRHNFNEILGKNPASLKMLSVINESAIRLINIVNQFIDSSTLEQKKMLFQKNKLNLNDVVSQVVTECSPSAQEKNIKLLSQIESQIEIIADDNHLKQVLLNLVTNGIKFTNAGSVRIVASKTGPNAQIWITDTGKGIAPKLQNLLFRKFQQAVENIYTRDGVQQGTGLGLYISKLLVEGMGGKLWLVESDIGLGTTFSFTIPLAS